MSPLKIASFQSCLNVTIGFLQQEQQSVVTHCVQLMNDVA